MLPLRESNGLRRFAFDLDCFGGGGLVQNRHFVAVLIAMSFPFARTVICALFACITKPSNLSSPVGFGFGLTAATMIGTAVSTTIGTTTGTCAAAGEEKTPAAASINGSANPATLTLLVIPRRP